jgi:predicted MFS family arabinose efflux permease
MKPVFYALAAAAFVSGANLRLFDALLPTIADDFAVPPTTASVVVTAFTLAYGLFQLAHGPLGDRIGKLKMIATSSFIAAAASIGSAFAESLTTLTVLRFATGIGAGGIIPLALAWIGDTTPYEKRQATLARFIGVVLVGHILGPVLGGVLAQFFTWRAVFFVFAVMFLAVGIVLLAQDRRAPKPSPSSPDRRSGVVQGYIEVLRDRWVRTVLFTVAVEGALFYGAFAYTGAYLKEKFGLSYFTIGAIIAALGLGGVLYSLLVRWLLRRLGEPGLVLGGGLILFTCYLVLPLLPAWQAFFPLLIAAGIGFYMFHNTLQTRSTEMAPQARGTALALHAFCMFLGQAIGVALCGLVIRGIEYGWTYVLTGIGLLLLGYRFAGQIRSHKAVKTQIPGKDEVRKAER